LVMRALVVEKEVELVERVGFFDWVSNDLRDKGGVGRVYIALWLPSWLR